MRCFGPRVSSGRSYEVKPFYRSTIGFDDLFFGARDLGKKMGNSSELRKFTDSFI